MISYLLRWVKDKDVENVSMKSEDDMIDDLERVRRYKVILLDNLKRARVT